MIASNSPNQQQKSSSFPSPIRSTIVLFFLGFSSGLPLALTSGTLQAWLTISNIDLETIGFISLVGQAYVFKPVWAPLMDRYQLSFFGRRRGWLILTQFGLILTLFIMSRCSPKENLHFIAMLAALIAFFSASQDIAFDAYRTDLLPNTQRGLGSAVSTAGYRLAMLVSGGFALWLTGMLISWHSLYVLMSALMVIGLITTFFSQEPNTQASQPKTIEQAFVIPFSEFFKRNNCWIILVLIILYKLSDAFAMSLSTSFLIRGVGFTLEQIGAVNKIFGLMAAIAGALFGGYLMRYLTLFQALMIFGVLQGASNIGYWFLSVTDKNIYSMATVIFVENYFSGMGTTAFIALLMALCNRSFTASQFALLSALSAVGRVYVPPVAAWIVEDYNWSTLYLVSVLIMIPALLLLRICKNTLEYTHKTGRFQVRQHFAKGYRFTCYLLAASAIILAIALLLKIIKFINPFINLNIISELVSIGFSVGALALVIGCVLDYFALKRHHSLREID